MSGMSRNTVGHSGKCTVCQLCLKSNAKIKHLNQMNVQPQFKEAYTWLKEHQPTINDSACICLPCVKQIQRNHSKEFTPRWLPKPPVPLKLCNLEHCKCIVYAQTTLVTVDELEKCLKQKVNAFTVTSDQSNSIGLCRQHYMLMYNTLHAAPCDSCLAKPKKGETFNRHCSSPEVVNEYLSHVSAENSQLTSASTVCLTCYKYLCGKCLRILPNQNHLLNFSLVAVNVKLGAVQEFAHARRKIENVAPVAPAIFVKIL